MTTELYWFYTWNSEISRNFGKLPETFGKKPSIEWLPKSALFPKTARMFSIKTKQNMTEFVKFFTCLWGKK
jgi:hypothetical protein